MKKLTNIVIMIGLLAIAGYAHSAVSVTQSYQVSVTIPAVVGVNYHPQETQPKEISQKINQEIQFEEVVRDSKVVLLETMTLK